MQSFRSTLYSALPLRAGYIMGRGRSLSSISA